MKNLHKTDGILYIVNLALFAMLYLSGYQKPYLYLLLIGGVVFTLFFVKQEHTSNNILSFGKTEIAGLNGLIIVIVILPTLIPLWYYFTSFEVIYLAILCGSQIFELRFNSAIRKTNSTDQNEE